MSLGFWVTGLPGTLAPGSTQTHAIFMFRKLAEEKNTQQLEGEDFGLETAEPLPPPRGAKNPPTNLALPPQTPYQHWPKLNWMRQNQRQRQDQTEDCPEFPSLVVSIVGHYVFLWSHKARGECQER